MKSELDLRLVAIWFVAIIAVSLLYIRSEPKVIPSTSDSPAFDSLNAEISSVSARKILLRKHVYETLRHAYKGQNGEFPFCLHGVENKDSVVVTSLRVPYVKASGRSSGRFNNARCALSPTYLGMVHNHPSGVCFPSSIDLDRFNGSPYATLEVVGCRNMVHGVSFFGIAKSGSN